MPLDALSVVVAFLAVIEVALGVAAAALGIASLRTARDDSEARRPLVALVAGTLVAAAAVSVPLFWMLLESWVPRWPGVVCVEGVRRIGMQSPGAVGLLPGLVTALDVAKPLVVFAAGAWLVLRRRSGAARAAAMAVAALGLVATFDGAAQAAYVVIPKQEVAADAGCCTMTTQASAREAGLVATGSRPDDAGHALAVVFFVATALLGAASLAVRDGGGVAGARATGAVLCAGAAAAVPVATKYFADVVAPSVLGLPYHRCVWCAIAVAPETGLAAALVLGGVFCVGWAWIARLASGGVSDPSPRLYDAAGFCLLGAAAMAAGFAVCS